MTLFLFALAYAGFCVFLFALLRINKVVGHTCPDCGGPSEADDIICPTCAAGRGYYSCPDCFEPSQGEHELCDDCAGFYADGCPGYGLRLELVDEMAPCRECHTQTRTDVLSWQMGYCNSCIDGLYAECDCGVDPEILEVASDGNYYTTSYEVVTVQCPACMKVWSE